MITNYLVFAIGILTLFNVFTISKSEGLQCMGEDGKPVDWYIIYKLPKLEKVKGSTQEEDDERGLKYLYMSSSKMRSPGWKYPGKLITDIDSFPGMTLKPLYAEGKTDQIWILYNDQPPEGSKVKGTPGHTKGVVATNKDGGFWIVHSVPRFPNVPSSGEYNYTESGRNNGQTMLCMTLKSTEMEKVATQLQYNQAGVYYSFFTQTMESQFPTLVNVAKKLTTKLPDNSHIVELKTVGNKVFKSFAKNREFNDDLYDKLVAPELKVDMQVETWRNGGGTPLPSDCQADYKVMNIESLNLCVKKECDLFPSTKDHSKWASSVESASPWVCIGDINRAKSQSGRGGGTVCINNKLVWNAFSSAVNGLQACDAKPKSPKSTKSTIPTVEIVQ